jgi:hypothetical protein
MIADFTGRRSQWRLGADFTDFLSRNEVRYREAEKINVEISNQSGTDKLTSLGLSDRVAYFKPPPYAIR